MNDPSEPCDPNPKVLHGFDRYASHNAGSYVCICGSNFDLVSERKQKEINEKLPLPELMEYSSMQQMKDECDSYRDMMDAFSADNDLLYAILRRAEVEMRYAGWGDYQDDNYGRYEVYRHIQEVLKGEEMSDAESQEPVESNDLLGFISDDRSHILVYPKGSYPVDHVDLYTAPPKREWVGLTEQDVEQWNIFGGHHGRTLSKLIRSVEAKLKEKNQ